MIESHNNSFKSARTYKKKYVSSVIRSIAPTIRNVFAAKNESVKIDFNRIWSEIKIPRIVRVARRTRFQSTATFNAAPFRPLFPLYQMRKSVTPLELGVLRIPRSVVARRREDRCGARNRKGATRYLGQAYHGFRGNVALGLDETKPPTSATAKLNTAPVHSDA